MKIIEKKMKNYKLSYIQLNNDNLKQTINYLKLKKRKVCNSFFSVENFITYQEFRVQIY
jgi:hypothetical protein